MAKPGEKFIFRDGTPARFMGRLTTVQGDHARVYRFLTLDVNPPHECYRSRFGKFGLREGDIDGRDIVGKLPEPKLDLTNHNIGQFYRMRNGGISWLQQLKNPEVIYRWVVGLKDYRADGTLLAGGKNCEFDLVEALTPEQVQVLNAHPVEAPAKLDITKYPLGQPFKRRDGEIVRLINRDSLTKWKYKVGGETYDEAGFYMNPGQPNPKDLVEVLPLAKATPLTVPQAFRALRETAKSLKKADCDKIIGLIEFLESETKP